MTEVVTVAGWEVVRLTSDALQVDVLPGKGGDILSARALPSGVDVLWRSPWGLRPRGVATGGSSVVSLMEAYPGGWQTVFPNAGDPAVEHGVEWGMHGEAWLAPWEWAPVDSGVELTTRLVRSPFTLVKRITLSGATVTVEETARNDGGGTVEAMWSHHPAFGPPLLAPGARVACGATTVLVDDVRDTPSGDLLVGGTGTWPYAPSRTGGSVDLSVVPEPPADRFLYLADFERPYLSLSGGGLTATVEWDLAVMPYAWFWLELGATDGFPWFRRAHVLGLEPASSHPGQGIAAARAKTGTQLAFAPGQARTATVSLTVSPTA